MALAAVKVLIRSSESSMIGERCQVHRHTNTAPRTTAARNEPTIRGLVQPHSCPLTTPRTRVAMLSANSIAPGRSGKRRRPGARLSTSRRRASRTAAAPIGMLTRNTSRQSSTLTSRPPSEGPRPAEPAATADSSATPCERRSGGKACSTRASEEGTSSAAPSACRTRKATRVSTEGATAHSSDAAVNSSSPRMNIRRRPRRSAIRPEATRNAANTML